MSLQICSAFQLKLLCNLHKCCTTALSTQEAFQANEAVQLFFPTILDQRVEKILLYRVYFCRRNPFHVYSRYQQKKTQTAQLRVLSF